MESHTIFKVSSLWNYYQRGSPGSLRTREKSLQLPTINEEIPFNCVKIENVAIITFKKT